MKPKKDQISELCRFLRLLHGSKLEELKEKGKIFAEYLNSLDGFQIGDVEIPHKHVGVVIVDVVLQQGKDFEKQVRPAIKSIFNFNEAKTVSGFIQLLMKYPLGKLINFKTERTKHDLLRVVKYFADRRIDTFEQLYT